MRYDGFDKWKATLHRKQLQIRYKVRLYWIKYHPNGNPIGEKTPNRGKERYGPMLRHYQKYKHLDNTKYQTNQSTDVPDKVDLFLSDL